MLVKHSAPCSLSSINNFMFQSNAADLCETHTNNFFFHRSKVSTLHSSFSCNAFPLSASVSYNVQPPNLPV